MKCESSSDLFARAAALKRKADILEKEAELAATKAQSKKEEAEES